MANNHIFVENKNPYVGPRPFQKGEKLYGRDRETFELANLLIAERIVLLYSPAGAGKSSLLAAAMPPALEKQGFCVLGPVRPGQEPPKTLERKSGFNRYAYSLMVSLEESLPKSQRFPTRKLSALRLADYVAEYRARAKQNDPAFDERQPLALIIDQTEETITKNPADRDAKADFFTQVGEALRDRSLYALFSIREDFLASLDPYLGPVPTRLATRYRLNMLDTGEAMQAIQQPAKQAGMGFADEAAKKLVDDLRRIRVQQADGTMAETLGLYVEPVQLQVVCRRLWTKVIPNEVAAAADDEDLAGFDYAVGGITEDDIASLGDIDNALADYYAMQVEDVAKKSKTNERAIREWFDKKLITPQGVRGQVLMAPETSEGLKNKTIWLLEQTYLIRADKRGGATWFELAHDRLIKPVRENNAVWFEENLSMVQRQAEVWNAQGRADGLLISGKDFLEARKWALSHARKMTPVEKEFLAACQKGYDQAVRDRRMNIAIRWLGVGAVLLSIVAVIFALLAVKQTRVATARQLAAQANSDLIVNPSISVLEALQAIDETKYPLPVAEDALRRAIPQLRVERVFYGHEGGVYSVDYSPDGKSIASAGIDGAVRIWDIATGQVKVFNEDTEMTAVAYSPDGKQLAAGGEGGLLKILSVETGSVLFSFTGNTGATWDLAFSPDGDLLASANSDDTVIVWDAHTGKKLRVLIGYTLAVEGVAFSPDGKLIATAGDDKTVRIWNAETGELLKILDKHTNIVNAVAFSPDGRFLATGGADRLIILWDTATFNELMTIPGHLDWVYDLAFTADSSTLISTSADRTIRFWDTTYGRLQMTLTGHTDDVYSLALSPDGLHMATSSEDGTVRLWGVSPSGSHELVSMSDEGKRVYDVAYSPDGTRIVSGGGGNWVKVWDAVTGQTLLKMQGHTLGVEGVAYNPDGTRIASSSRDGTLRVWDAATGALVWTVDAKIGTLWSVAFNSDGSRIAASGDNGMAKVWDARTGTELLALDSQTEGSVFCLAYSPDGTRLATTYLIEDGSDEGANLWDAGTGELIAELRGHTAWVETVAFSQDGTLLATGSDDSTAIIWDLRPESLGDILYTLKGHRAVIYDLAFSPDGKYLATGSADTETRLWSVETGKLTSTLYGHADRIYAVAFSPDGRYLATAGADATIHVHYMQLSDLIQSAFDRVILTVTSETCREYLATCPEP